MKTNKLLLTAIILSPFVCFLSPGCIEKKQVVEEASIASLQADTTVSLNTAVESSPNCKIHLDFMYLKCSDKDSVSQSVNQTLQSIFFNEQLLRISNLYSVWSQIITHFKIFFIHFRIFPKHFC